MHAHVHPYMYKHTDTHVLERLSCYHVTEIARQETGWCLLLVRDPLCDRTGPHIAIGFQHFLVETRQ